MLITAVVVVVLVAAATTNAVDLVGEDVSILSSDELVYDADGAEIGNHSHYIGQFHKDAVNSGSSVKYDFRNPIRLDLDTHYLALSEISLDAPALDWSSATLLSSANLLDSSDLIGVGAVATKAITPSGYEIYEQYSTNLIRFSISITSCLNGYLNLTVLSSITLQPPVAGASSMTVINGNCELPLLNQMDINKADCGVVDSVESLVVITSGEIINNDNSQMFALTCSVNTDNFDVETNVTDVSAPVTEIQNVFDSAFVSSMSLLDPADEQPLTSAELGDPVMIKIELENTFKNDFDIKINDCFVDGELVLDDGLSVNYLFPAFAEESKGLFKNSFNLFRKKNSNLNERTVTFVCVVETCLDECTAGSSRKKRSLLIKKSIRDSRISQRIGMRFRL